MSRQPPVSVPTTAPLPPTLRLDPQSPLVQRSISRLSRASLIALALDWLEPHSVGLAAPSLRPPPEDNSLNEDGDAADDDDEEEDDFYPRARTVGGLRKLYAGLQTLSGSKKDVADRITEGDWRHGLTLYQLAMLDFQHLHDHPTSLKWSAYRLVPVKLARKAGPPAAPRPDKTSLLVPRFHPSTFLQRLQAQVMPDSKTHFHFTRPHDRPVALLRIFILDTPYNTSLAQDTVHGFDSARSIVVAFPDNSPYVYLSNAQGAGSNTETKKMRNLIVEGLPRALSRPGEMYALKPTALVSKNLDALLAGKGPGPASAAQGGWSVYVEEHRRASPLDMMLPVAAPAGRENRGSAAVAGAKRKAVVAALPTKQERIAKRARAVAQARFGNTAQIDDGQGVEKVLVVLREPFRGTAGPVLVDEGDGEVEGDTAMVARRFAGGRSKRSIHASFSQDSDDEDDDDGDDDDGDDDEEGDDDDDDGDESISNALRRQSQHDAAAAAAVGGAAQTKWCPAIQLTFQGAHVFAGIRQLVEAGIIDGARMPGWMTGEEGVTVGVVRNGRIRGHNGSGCNV